MGYEILDIDNNIIEIDVIDTITLEDELELLSKLENEIKNNGKINILIHLEKNINFEFKAAIEDFKGFLKLGDKIEKIAIISNQKIWNIITTFSKPLISFKHIQSKFFLEDETLEAWEWIKDSNNNTNL